MPREGNRQMTTLRFPPELLDRLREVAAAEKRSVTRTIEVAVEEYLGRWERRRKRQRPAIVEVDEPGQLKAA